MKFVFYSNVRIKTFSVYVHHFPLGSTFVNSSLDAGMNTAGTYNNGNLLIVNKFFRRSLEFCSLSVFVVRIGIERQIFEPIPNFDKNWVLESDVFKNYILNYNHVSVSTLISKPPEIYSHLICKKMSKNLS